MVKACVDEVRSSLKIEIEISLLVIQQETFGQPKAIKHLIPTSIFLLRSHPVK